MTDDRIHAATTLRRIDPDSDEGQRIAAEVMAAMSRQRVSMTDKQRAKHEASRVREDWKRARTGNQWLDSLYSVT